MNGITFENMKHIVRIYDEYYRTASPLKKHNVYIIYADYKDNVLTIVYSFDYESADVQLDVYNDGVDLVFDDIGVYTSKIENVGDDEEFYAEVVLAMLLNSQNNNDD